jgi:hypothetical protein
MNRPLALHLKAATLCALAAIALSLPLLWLPLLPAWPGDWRPPILHPSAEALLAVFVAWWVAWCVVDIPRRGLKVLVWVATLWLLGGGIWLAGLYGYAASSLVPMTAAGLAGAGALAFGLSPAGSRRARWEALVGDRVAPEFLRARIDEQHLEVGPRTEHLAVAEVWWPDALRKDRAAWEEMEGLARRAGHHFRQAGGYLERCDGEGALFVFGAWGQKAEPPSVVGALWQWVQESGGCASLTRGECLAGVGNFPDQARWTVTGTPLRRAQRLAAAARSYAAGIVVEEDFLKEVTGFWRSRRLAWWDFEGQRVLLHEVTGPAEKAPFGAADDLRRWNLAWDFFWTGRWEEAGTTFATLAREKNDPVARIFALRCRAAQRGGSGA